MNSHFYCTLVGRSHDPIFARFGRLCGIGRWMLCGLIALCLAASTPGSCQPRGQDKQTAASAAEKATLDLVNDLNDIHYLQDLYPLKLTPEQLNKMIAAITSAQETYTKKVNALAADRVDKMADEIRAVKRKALAGEKVPADFDARMKQASDDFIAKRAQLNLNNIAAVASALRAILTPDQIAAAVKITRDVEGSKVQGDKTTDAQWFNLYVTEVVIGYPQIVPLLKEMRTAKKQS